MYEWNGKLVHRSEFEPRQPQDLIQTPIDDPAVKDGRARGPIRYPVVTPDDL